MTSIHSTFARELRGLILYPQTPLFYACLMAVSVAAGCGQTKELPAALRDGGGTTSHPSAASTSAQPAKGKPSAGDDACERLCAMAAKLHCPKDGSTCLADCSEMRDPPLCRHEMHAFVQCALGTSISDWHCDEDGESSVKDGVCEIEQREVARCVEQAASAS